MANENETVEQVCKHLLNTGRYYYGIEPRHIKALENYVNLILAAHKRELAAKDAEIEDLKVKNTEAFKAVLKRDALINELSKGLNSFDMCHSSCDACKYADIVGFNCPQKMVRALIAKAREAIK